MSAKVGFAGLLAAAALAAAGCGGGASTTADEAGAITGDEWIAQADAICEKGDAEIEEAGDALGKKPSPEDQAEYAENTVLPSVQSQVDQVAALPVPEGWDEQVSDLVASAQQGIDDLTADPTLLGAEGDEDPFAETRDLAKDLGLKHCAQG